jgi:hypothetical protein
MVTSLLPSTLTLKRLSAFLLEQHAFIQKTSSLVMSSLLI